MFVLQGGLFYNASVSSDGSGLSAQTVRNYYIYAADIDNDGIIELPRPVQLPQARESDTESFWVIDWYNLTLEGEQQSKLLSYHNYAAGWYLELPESWRDELTVYRTEGNAGWIYTFARWNGEGQEPTPLVHISPISGSGARLSNGWFVLGTVSDVTYVALIPPEAADWSGSLDRQELIDRFHVIRYDWNTGET